jgi:hypothetical protein
MFANLKHYRHVFMLSGALIWPFRRQMTLSQRMTRIIACYQRVLDQKYYFLAAIRVFVFVRSVMSDGLEIPLRMMGNGNTTSEHYNCSHWVCQLCVLPGFLKKMLENTTFQKLDLSLSMGGGGDTCCGNRMGISPLI